MRPDSYVPDVDFSRTGKSGVALNHGNAEFLKSLDRIMRRDRVDRRADVSVDALEIDCWHRIDSKLMSTSHSMSNFRSGQEGLRRDAPEIEAFAAHTTALDENDFCPELGCDGSDRKSCGARADHTEIRLQVTTHAK